MSALVVAVAAVSALTPMAATAKSGDARPVVIVIHDDDDRASIREVIQDVRRDVRRSVREARGRAIADRIRIGDRIRFADRIGDRIRHRVRDRIRHRIRERARHVVTLRGDADEVRSMVRQLRREIRELEARLEAERWR